MFPGGDVASGTASEIHACKLSGIVLTVWQIVSRMRSTLHREQSWTATVITYDIRTSAPAQNSVHQHKFIVWLWFYFFFY